MHEMPYTQAILDLALKEAGGARIRCIYLRVGWMSSIVPRSVQAFFDYLSKGTAAQDAELIFEMTPIKLICQHCDRTMELPYNPEQDPRRALADAFRKGCVCGKGMLKIVDGLGCDLAGIEVAASKHPDEKDIA
jgi:Zn finger protein HypA/HybF involved in hydrogenase expression